ncbi:MAG TPA: hypothetical protein VJT31_14370, partial [Rugosimonospora sp.]|nr:hypothetical protein [Rugosimonospora sp.]
PRLPVLGTALADGAYLSAWPVAGAVALPAALLLGLLVGWRPWSAGDTYTATLLGMSLLVTVASLGAAPGTWATIGYVLGDLALHQHGQSFYGSFTALILTVIVPLFIGYLLLASALVLTPLVAARLGRRTVSWIRLSARPRPPTALAATAAALIAAALLWAWTHTVPTLIRPVYTWSGGQPPTDAIAPVQTQGAVLIVLALAVTAARVVAEDVAARRPRPVSPAPPATLRPARPWPLWVSVPLRTLLTTFLMAGLFTAWWHALAFAAVFAGALALRGTVLERSGAWARLVNRVPLLLRLLAAVAVSFVMAQVLIAPAWSGTDSFLPVLASATTALLVAALLLPGRPRRAAKGPGSP